MRTTRHSKNAKQRGFTLIELVVAATVSVFVIIISTQLLMTMLRVESRHSNKYVMDKQALVAAQEFARDVQAAHTINVATANSVDMDITEYGNGTVNVVYAVEEKGNSGKFSLSRNGEVISEGITDYTIHYFDYDRNETTDVDDIRFAQLVMSLERAGYKQTYTRELVTPLVMLRNKTFIY